MSAEKTIALYKRNVKRAAKPRAKRKPRPRKLAIVSYRERCIIFSMPVAVVSEANSREHWSKKNARKRMQQFAVMAFLRASFDWRKEMVRAVTLVRFGMRKLDGDNLQSAFKAVRDTVAKFLGVDDGNERVQYRYAQVAPSAEDGIEVRFSEAVSE